MKTERCRRQTQYSWLVYLQNTQIGQIVYADKEGFRIREFNCFSVFTNSGSDFCFGATRTDYGISQPSVPVNILQYVGLSCYVLTLYSATNIQLSFLINEML